MQLKGFIVAGMSAFLMAVLSAPAAPQ